MKCRKSEPGRNVENGVGDLVTNLDDDREKKLDDEINNKDKLIKEQPFMLPKDPLEYHGQWICNTCNGEVDGFTIWSLVRELQAEVDSIKGDEFFTLRNKYV